MCQKIFPKLLLLRCSSQMPLHRLLQKLRLWGLSLNQSWIIWSASACRCDRFPKPLSGHCRPYQKATKIQGWPPSETTGLYVPPEPEVRLTFSVVECWSSQLHLVLISLKNGSWVSHGSEGMSLLLFVRLGPTHGSNQRRTWLEFWAAHVLLNGKINSQKRAMIW